MELSNKYGPAFFGVIFLLIMYLLWLMVRQMIEPIIFGLIISGVFYPLHTLFQEKWKLSRHKAASLTSLIIVIGVLVPLSFIVISIGKEAAGLYARIGMGLDQEEVSRFFFGDGLAATTIKSLADFFEIEVNLEMIKANLLSVAQGASTHFLTGVNSLVGDIVNFFFNLVIMMIVIFGLLVEGEKLKMYTFELSPLPSDQEQMFLEKFNQMNYVTLVCNGVGGIIQGVLGGLALWAAGIGSVLLWTFVMIILAFIPLVGISFVTIPASLYLILTGDVFAGLLLFTFSATVGLIVENWFKPKFIGGRIQINATFVLLSIIGGLWAFGMGGIFYGPIIGILFLTIVEMYHEHYSRSRPTHLS